MRSTNSAAVSVPARASSLPAVSRSQPASSMLPASTTSAGTSAQRRNGRLSMMFISRLLMVRYVRCWESVDSARELLDRLRQQQEDQADAADGQEDLEVLPGERLEVVRVELARDLPGDQVAEGSAHEPHAHHLADVAARGELGRRGEPDGGQGKLAPGMEHVGEDEPGGQDLLAVRDDRRR